MSIPGWSCVRIAELYEAVCLEKGAGIFVECGVAYGKSLAMLAGQASLRVDILAVDIFATFQGRDNLDAAEYQRMREHVSPLEAARSNVRGAVTPEQFRRIEWIQARSEDVPRYLDFDVDFVFLDDHHEYESVLAEIRAWLPRLKSGGILAGHDINSHYPGVKKACDAAFGIDACDVRPPHPDENGWGGVWKWRKP